jgi:hypothetical protein
MRGPLPSWLADWLVVAPPTSADAATWQLDSVWRWAPWATLLLVVGAIAWTVFLYMRESTSASRKYRALLVGMRLAALAILLIMLAQLAIALRLTGPPTIAVVFDRSASMAIADRYGDNELVAQLARRLRDLQLDQPTRLNLAKLLVLERDGQFLHELAKRFRLKFYLVAEAIEQRAGDTQPAELIDEIRGLSADAPGSQATRLGDAVRRVLDDFRASPPAAVILLSDGVTTAGVPLLSAAQEARSKGVPIIAIGLGNSEPSQDIELADVLVDDAVFVDDLVSFQVRIKASGLAGQPAKVILRRDGEAAPLAEESVTLPSAGETLTAVLMDRPSAGGQAAYAVEILPLENEINKDNNRQRRNVDVSEEKIRVLLVQGYPSFEFRHLKMLLERDRTIQLSVYLQDADPEFAQQDKSALRAFPVSRNELMDYDVLVVGDVDPRLLPRNTWQNIRSFVSEKGGGLAVLAGPRYLPWLYRENADVRALLPIEIESLAAPAEQLSNRFTNGFVVQPTPIGLQSPALQLGDATAEVAGIWNNLAALYWLAGGGETKPGAQVWAVAAALSATPPASQTRPQTASQNPPREAPVILFQYVGPGRVLYHAMDSTWRWRLGAGDAYFARFWVQSIRFLARTKLQGGRGANLSADRREYHPREAVQLRARFMDPRTAPAGDDVTVLVDRVGERRRRIALHRNTAATGVFEGEVTDLAEGQYEAVLTEPRFPGTAPSTRFSVLAPPGELAHVEMDAASLAAAAETTRGNYYTIADADRLLRELPAGRRVPLENLPPIPLWNRWWLLAAFLSCITCEWVLRKRKGML